MMNCGYDPDPAGEYDMPPIAPQIWHAYHIAGEQLAIGIIAALIHRHRSGQGQDVSVRDPRGGREEHRARPDELGDAAAAALPADLPARAEPRSPTRRSAHTKDGRWDPVDARGRARRAQPAAVPGRATGWPTGSAEVDRRAAAGGAGGAPGRPAPPTAEGASTCSASSARFTYEDMPVAGGAGAGLLWAPLRKPHENALDEHWLTRGTFAEVEHPELAARSATRPASGSPPRRLEVGRRAPLLGEDDAARDGWLASEDEDARSGYRTVPSSPVKLRDSRAGSATPGGSLACGGDAGPSGQGVDSPPHGKPFPLQGCGSSTSAGSWPRPAARGSSPRSGPE